MKGLIYKIESVIANLALTVTTLDVNTTCTWILHQPKLPKDAEKLRRS